ncbi:MAG: PrpF family protein [Betaproteobacteria bacterium]|jgi:2-methylaconitate cis-trans-isomerase PrpF|nr:PrpF family protein [Betaproteobacteria bacterium]MDH4293160.1 PrpF family protein [Betaproteobacteria bacterium]
MKQLKLPAVFMRGGTSNAVVFNQRNLPQDRALWDEIFLAAIGSPDPNGRQLDGMGGGVSSLSKVCVVGPPTRADADIDYTFAQVQVKEAKVDYGANCGNMSSAMGPFAVDEGLVRISGHEALVRIHNTNTKKIIHALFSIDDGMAAVDGDLAIPGVSGTGSPVKLEFRDPGGATTGRLLPTGNVVDTLDVPGVGKIRASMVDAANATVWIDAKDIGLTGIELPEPLEANAAVMQKLSAIRIAASVAMGITANAEEAAKKKSVPFIGFVSAAQDAKMLSGEAIAAADIDLTGRVISNGQPHRALPLTVSLCMAVAARIEGSVVNAVLRKGGDAEAPIRIGMPSGILTVAATVKQKDGQWQAEQGAFYRTQRRMFEGQVLVRASRVPGMIALGRQKAA